MKSSRSLLSAVAALVVASSAHAVLPATVVVCDVTDLSPVAEECQGFYSGQYLSGNAGDVLVQQEALAELDFAWDGTTVVSFQAGLGGATVINFASPLAGLTYIGVHYGAGTGSPGGLLDPKQDTTAFYRLDAGAGLSSFTLNYGASSDVKVYFTTPAIPEPETYALMLAGLGAVGFMARRRRRQA